MKSSKRKLFTKIFIWGIILIFVISTISTVILYLGSGQVQAPEQQNMTIEELKDYAKQNWNEDLLKQIEALESGNISTGGELQMTGDRQQSTGSSQQATGSESTGVILSGWVNNIINLEGSNF